MKKMLVLLSVLALCAGLLIYSLLPTGPRESPTEPVKTEPSTVPAREPPAALRISFANGQPQLQEAWAALAAEFSVRSNVNLSVVDAAEGQNATLFTLTDEDDLQQWASQCADLSCTDAYGQIVSVELALQADGNVCGLPLEVESFGLAYNAALLAQAGYTRADIRNFEELRTVVQAISANREELGCAAFAVPQAGLAEHFAGLSGDLRAFLDLYIQNTAANLPGQGLTDFLEGRAVFYPASTANHHQFAALGEHQLGFLPLYSGGENAENGILHVKVNRYLCVRADADPKEAEAAVAFLSFLVQPRKDGTVPMDDLKLLTPYRQTVYGGNKLEAAFREELASGRACRNCAHIAHREGLSEALTAYVREQTDENWNKIAQLLEN